MENTFPELLLILFSLAVGGAVQPPQVAAGILLLLSERGILNNLAFNGAMIAWRLGQGLFFWYVLSQVETAVESGHSRFSVVMGMALLVLGIVFLVYAARRLFQTSGPNEATDDMPSGMTSLVRDATPSKAAMLGLAFVAIDVKDWLLTMAAVNVIVEADVSPALSVALYLLYILLVQSVTLVPLIVRMIFPTRATTMLAALDSWLEKHDRILTAAMLALMGIIFVALGFEQLDLI
jgi:hypothetical protein